MSVQHYQTMSATGDSNYRGRYEKLMEQYKSLIDEHRDLHAELQALKRKSIAFGDPFEVMHQGHRQTIKTLHEAHNYIIDLINEIESMRQDLTKLRQENFAIKGELGKLRGIFSHSSAFPEERIKVHGNYG